MTTQTELFKVKANPKVSGHGYGSAEIFFLSGFPSKTDLLNGLALTGHAESTLNTFLYPHKLNLKNCYRSSFIKEQLSFSGNNSKKVKDAVDKMDVEGYLDILYEEIKEVAPNLIVPLDDVALGAVFPHINGLHKPKGRKHWVYCYRGSILPLRADFSERLGRSIKVIPTLHPTQLEIDWTARAYVQLDYVKIKEWMNSTQPIEEYGLTWVARTAVEFERFLMRAYSKNPKRVSFDIETYGGMITCISFCFDSYEACTVPLNDYSLSLAERVLLHRLVGRVLADTKIEKNNQNIKYDWIILERFGFKINNVRSDTMLKGALLYPELPKGLDFYTSIYTPIPYYKDEGKEFNPKLHSRDRLYIYCAKDSLSAQIISEKEDVELEENNLKELYETEVAPSILIYKNIDETGLLVDDSVRTHLLNKYEALYDSNLSLLRGLCGNDSFNPASPKQVGELVYETLKYPARRKTLENGTTSFVTNKETLDDLLINCAGNNKAGAVGVSILSRVIVCRKLAKIIEYIETPLHPDGTFRGSSNLSGTETGRSSFSKTIDEIILRTPRNNKWTRRLGRSLQTITKHGFQIDDDIFEDFGDSKIADDLRTMFVPHKNYVFIEGDGSGAEARAVFVLAEDYDGLESMDKKPKIHAKTAALLFNVDVNTITKDFPSIPKVGIAYYDMGKRVRHAGNYDMGAFRLAQMTHLPLAECQAMLDKFHQANPSLRGVFHKEVFDFVSKHRYLITPYGRRRDFFAKFSKDLLKEALAYIPQSLISDITKFTMPRITSELPGYMTKYKFVTEQHDGILAEVHKDYAVGYVESFKRLYERKVDFRKGSLPRDFDLVIPAEMAMSSENWKNLIEFKI
jgi:DNA polymerase I-like protein with 3'-5' exonuclease and polymerase domains/uracil-DNA glycosylase